MVQANCEHCGQKYNTYPSSILAGRRFCSRRCEAAHKTKPLEERICQYCGSTFTVYSYGRVQNQIFCSIQCANIGRHTLSDEERFWRFVNKTDSCWLWTGGKVGGGYGVFWRTQPKRCLQVAHRFAWELKYRSVHDDLILCHNCPGGDNPACIFWGHIFEGTYQDNTIDAVKKGMIAVGEECNLAKLNATDVLEIRRLRIAGVSRQERARMFNMTIDGIYRIDARINWKHLPLVEGESATL